MKPAVAVVIMNSEEILLSEIQGERTYNSNQKATINDFFHIGSCSKSVLANIAGKMIEGNKIKWNTKFFEVFPELKEVSEEEYYNITLEDLFLCKAGIKAHTSGEEQYPIIDSTTTNKRYEFAKHLLKLKPTTNIVNGKFEFNYSNASYTLASQMLERISKLTYEKLIHKHLNEEMNIQSHFGFPNKLDSNQPWGHMIIEDNVDTFPPDHEYKIPYLIKPAGDLSMTPLNFARYIQMQLKGLNNGNKYLSKDMYRHIHFGYNGFSIGVGNNEMAGYKYSGMDGSAGTFFCRAIIVPESDFAFVIMTNAGSGKAEMEAIDWMALKIVKKQYNWWWKFWM